MIRRVALLVTMALAADLLAGCGGGSNKPQGRSEAQQITAVWTSFFSTSGTVQQKEALLQNGSQLTAMFQALQKLENGNKLSTQVSNVQVNGNTANVTFTIKFGAQTLGPETGLAVKVGNSWLVSAKTFCGLASLATGSSKLPAACTS